MLLLLSRQLRRGLAMQSLFEALGGDVHAPVLAYDGAGRLFAACGDGFLRSADVRRELLDEASLGLTKIPTGNWLLGFP